LEETSPEDDLAAKIIEAIDPGAILTKYLFIAEGFNSNGDRAFYTVMNDGAMIWDTIGLLTYAQAYEEARLQKKVMDNEL
jgi:hypothetical protein